MKNDTKEDLACPWMKHRHTQRDDCPAWSKVKISALAWPRRLSSMSSWVHHQFPHCCRLCLQATSCSLCKRYIWAFYYLVSIKQNSQLVSIHTTSPLCPLNIKPKTEKKMWILCIIHLPYTFVLFHSLVNVSIPHAIFRAQQWHFSKYKPN